MAPDRHPAHEFKRYPGFLKKEVGRQFFLKNPVPCPGLEVCCGVGSGPEPGF